MPFNVDKFLSAKFTRVEKEVSVPDMSVFFGEGEEPVWIVKGLTASELARMSEAVRANQMKGDIIEGLMSGETRAVVNGIKSLIGADENVPDDIPKRIIQLIYGSVSPKVDQQTAVKISECYPIEFYQITNEITKLTGRGYELGKPKRSTKTAG